MLISFFLILIISTSPTVPEKPSPRFHVEAWLPFRNREMDYCLIIREHEMANKHMLCLLNIVVIIRLLPSLWFPSVWLLVISCYTLQKVMSRFNLLLAMINHENRVAK